MKTDQKRNKPKMTSMKIRKAVFPVAGLGTRLLPATKVMPKEMLTLVDRPLIQHAVEEAIDAGIEEFIFVTGRHKEMLEEHFDYQPELEETLVNRGKADLLAKIKSCGLPAGKLFLTRQPKALGLGHAIWCARGLIGNEPFAVLLPDDVFVPAGEAKGGLSQLINTYNQTGGNLCLAVNVAPADTKRYGILDIEQSVAPAHAGASTSWDPGQAWDDTPPFAPLPIRGMVEKPESGRAPSTLAIMGRYILQPAIFDHLAAFETGAGGEIQLTDAMAKLIGAQPFHAVRFNGTRYDCGTKLGFIETNMTIALRDPDIGADVRAIIQRLAADMSTKAA